MTDHPWVLSRITLRRDATAAALAPILLPDGRHSPTPLAIGHRLIWSLFADQPERDRDFLWREIEPGRFITFSARAPRRASDLVTVDEPKLLDVTWRTGQRLAFSLRANPTVARRDGKGRRGKRHDVIMDALRPIERGKDRRTARPNLERERGLAWLSARAERCGFALETDVNGTPCTQVDGYRQHVIKRRKGRRAVLSSLDFDGLLRITAPQVFAAALCQGVGPAKAFGCGLLLVRPAPLAAE
ncbi:CRISPR-associated Cse3 family protein [Rhodothalassium salexigens DSM 2132]|uniref:CRISPR-associated Cse3 family protein n=1 Tax=Rhodothalassium salexigens DSM 2132 TaxID=1188247 RepID=A0A4R2PNH4_RHOSA|nr:type I-E CRISPR-associated protein Cas6/Cse3/CasE [Rhodothalassium salexigens]MBB4210858.1 CRISPR system Cascade subunit CasE [Rhodothalassium salexigens DSM 2132]MBK1639147.1 type I-E CRISPR-associated protein Cas6/Cse3/CasE [Rhodothalassium salexigens DSM 2132]TCP36484.1 CRISPR-associated Cse3 family protein [Rhodothalassium salexigens DSM 2132]